MNKSLRPNGNRFRCLALTVPLITIVTAPLLSRTFFPQQTDHPAKTAPDRILSFARASCEHLTLKTAEVQEVEEKFMRGNSLWSVRCDTDTDRYHLWVRENPTGGLHLVQLICARGDNETHEGAIRHHAPEQVTREEVVRRASRYLSQLETGSTATEAPKIEAVDHLQSSGVWVCRFASGKVSSPSNRSWVYLNDDGAFLNYFYFEKQATATVPTNE